MLRAGMHLPAGPDSELPCYGAVLTEMGDEQSIEQSLSTFTAHLTHLLDFIERAGPGTLVLLDEIAIGTDPGEGAALAHALLEALVETGAQIVVTTHYERLKSLPIADERFVNASVGFELERMAPTYRLHLGVPGSSGALAVARRVGLPERIAARAAALLDRGAQELGTLLTALAGERTRLEEQRAALAKAEAETRAIAEEQRQAASQLRQRQREALAGEFSRALDELKRARQELERVRQLLRRTPTKERVAQADRQISAAAEAIRSHEPSETIEGLPAPLEAIVVGARLLVPRLGGVGEVVEAPARGKVLVRVGGIRSAVPVEDLRLHRAAPEGREQAQMRLPRVDRGAVSPDESRRGAAARDARPAAAEPPSSSARLAPLRTDEITLNVRGLRVDEAVAEVERFLDRALRSGDAVLYVIHGHGTGALKSALRAHLSASELVERIHPAEAKDGGDGVTVVWLK
jgi:DNA mismatch repair protein MutS2